LGAALQADGETRSADAASSIEGDIAVAVQGLLANLNGSFVRLLRKPIVQIDLDPQLFRLIG
jgi:hypothetical protein